MLAEHRCPLPSYLLAEPDASRKARFINRLQARESGAVGVVEGVTVLSLNARTQPMRRNLRAASRAQLPARRIIMEIDFFMRAGHVMIFGLVVVVRAAEHTRQFSTRHYVLARAWLAPARLAWCIN